MARVQKLTRPSWYELGDNAAHRLQRFGTDRRTDEDVIPPADASGWGVAELEVMEQAESTATKAFGDFEALKESLGRDVVQLWSDAFDFFREVRPTRPRITVEHRQRLARAAVLTAAAAYEAVTNFLSDQILEAPPIEGFALTEFEIDCLREKRKVLDGGIVNEGKQFYSSKERFLLVLRLSTEGPAHDKTFVESLDRSFKLRDSLVHPKPGAFVGMLTDESWTSAYLGFLTADLVLARMWALRKRQGSIKQRAFGGN